MAKKADGFSQCVPEKDVCNNLPDCTDDSDEVDCPGRSNTVPLHWLVLSRLAHHESKTVSVLGKSLYILIVN